MESGCRHLQQRWAANCRLTCRRLLSLLNGRGRVAQPYFSSDGNGMSAWWKADTNFDDFKACKPSPSELHERAAGVSRSVRRMRDMLFALCGDAQVLHHPMVAVEHDVTMSDEIASEALVTGAEDDPHVLLEYDRVLPLVL